MALAPADTSYKFTRFDAALYAGLIFGWSTSWYPLTLQVGVVAPEVSLAYRFTLAAFIVFIFLVATKKRIAFPLKTHARFAALGVFIFSTNFALFYYASVHIPSGLLSVMFSTASIISLILTSIIAREVPNGRLAVGGVLGAVGIALVFWPEIAGTVFDADVLRSVGLCLLGTLSFCCGSVVSASNSRAGIPIVSAAAWGMAYGALWMGFLAFVQGHPFIIDWRPAYIGSFLWLTIASTLLAFAVYLTLVQRIGAARAGYATVIFPIFALIISMVVEQFTPTYLTCLGLICVLTGNYFVLSKSAR